MRLYHIFSCFDNDFSIRVIRGCSIVYKGKLGKLLDNTKLNQLLHVQVHSINFNVIDHNADIFLVYGDYND